MICRQSCRHAPPLAETQAPPVIQMRYLTVRDVASMLQVSTRTIHRLKAAGEIPHYRIGRGVRFSADEIQEWLGKRR
jgi:excisionase family DNA binding protein